MTTAPVSLRGVSSLIAIDKRLGKPLYRQIYDAFRTRVTRGELRAGQVVPSTRELARELRVSRLPVLNAYAQLMAEGYFESRVGAGTFIATAFPQQATARAEPTATTGERRISAHAAALPAYERPTWAARLGPFQVGQPDLHSFPFDIWSRLVARYSRRMRADALQYGDPMGIPQLREAIAHYLRTSRGVRCDAQQVLIVSGSQQALDLATRVLLDSGDAAWVEDPGYWLVRHALTAAGARAIPVPLDSEGLSVVRGAQLHRKPRAIFTAPSHQYPLGSTMSAARRVQLLDFAERAGAWIVEDDYDSEYRYDSMPIASLQGLDRHARVIYVGTFSKVMFPSLRLGYLVVPADLAERFVAMRQVMDLGPAHITQAVMAEFIREGHFARHIRRMRPVYAERRRVLVAAISRELGDRVQIAGAEAGMHLALLLPGTDDDRAIAEKAAEESLIVSPLSPSYIGENARPGLVLGFGNTREAQIPGAVRQLKTILSSKRSRS